MKVSNFNINKLYTDLVFARLYVYAFLLSLLFQIPPPTLPPPHRPTAPPPHRV